MTIKVADQALSNSDFQIEGLDFIARGDQYLTFILGNEHYGIDILTVKEIRGWEPPTRIPRSPKHVKGVTNLRGLIVPIIDLREQFQIGETTYSPTTVVIVLSLNNNTNQRTMGFVVDAVSDVLNAEAENIKKPSAFYGNVDESYIEGLVNVGDNVVTILKVEQLLSLDESHVEH